MAGDFDLRRVLFYGGCGFTIMRCLSFALENCERQDGNYSILELLKYNFYLPFFYFGPVMTFDKFYAQVCFSSDDGRKEPEPRRLLAPSRPACAGLFTTLRGLPAARDDGR